MLLQNSLQQELIESIKKSLTFDVLYQRIRPDISTFISTTSTLSLKSLDYWERLIRGEISYSLQTSSSKHNSFESHQVGSLRWMDICNADGFRRERALRTLSGGAPNSFLLALVARKLNDWVPQVREAARDALSLIAEASCKTNRKHSHIADLYCACTNLECGHTFVMNATFSHTLSPSALTHSRLIKDLVDHISPQERQEAIRLLQVAHKEDVQQQVISDAKPQITRRVSKDYVTNR
ncbi:Phage transcriptional activator%2C Ogr/delta [Yersinia rohdei]|uniref:ogr/Delta-like zinc finger family protein n=1 Tax=Yersinia rohdei TaxID=29485 RepID=UPI0005E2DB49|nr:Phage transcriptional activator%2C Ogr/delta [Yersinia rohdei]